MLSNIYLDNNATTKCDEEVLNAMLPYLSNQYGNPSSTYSFGKEVKDKKEIFLSELDNILKKYN